jgi:hypothetical protein
LAITLVLLALLSLAVRLVQPLWPDTSVYLLHTRTWLETGNRYSDSHDSKGPLLIWLSAPVVRLVGAGAPAAGLLRGFAALVTAGVIWTLLRRRAPAGRSPWLPAALVVVLPVAPSLWGDSLRPENYATALAAVVLLLGHRGTRGAFCAAGALTAATFFLKSVLILPPALILTGLLVHRTWTHRRIPWADAGAMAGGALLAVGLILGALAATDSLPDWWRQTVTWPAEYRQAAPSPAPAATTGLTARALALYKATDDPHRPWLMPLKIPATLIRSGMAPLFLLALVMIWRPVGRWSALHALIGCWILGELFKLGLEYRRWMYPAAGLIPPLLLWIGLAPTGPRRVRWLPELTMLVVLPMLVGLLAHAGTLARARLTGAPLGPYEELAGQLRDIYRPGETLLVLDNNYALHLLLPAPPPPPVLSLHAAMVNPAERGALQRTIQASPPDWLVGRELAYTAIHLDDPASPTVKVIERVGELCLSGPYPLVVTNGSAWARHRAPP